MPSSSAIAAACSGPAPPNASSAKRRGSTPRSTVITRSARTISALATRTMPSAHSRASSPSASASRSTARVRGVGVERDAAGQRRVGVEVAEHEVGVGHRRLGAAAAVAGGAGLGARASAARRAARRPASRQAIEPPPAPTVWMSTIGSASGRPPTSRAAVSRTRAALDDAHVARRAAHVEAQQVGLAAALGRAAPRRPRRRPGRRARSARRGRRRPRASASPPLDCMIGGSGRPGLARRVEQAAQVARQQRRERGVDLGRRGALVLAERADDLVRQRDVRVAEALAQRVAERALVVGVAVGVQQADGDRLGLGAGDRVGERRRASAAARARRRAPCARGAAKRRSGGTAAPGARRTAGRGRRGPGGRARRRR